LWFCFGQVLLVMKLKRGFASAWLRWNKKVQVVGFDVRFPQGADDQLSEDFASVDSKCIVDRGEANCSCSRNY